MSAPDARGGFSRLRTAARPRPNRGQLLAGLLCGLLGFALVVQVQATQEQGLDDLRQSDLVRILDDVTERSARLEDEAIQLRSTRDDLASGSDSALAATEARREQLLTLGILAGTLPATGPGITLDIRDPDDGVNAAVLLDAVQELRDAGTEAVQVGDVRVVASTYFEDDESGVLVDGELVEAPYTFTAIGDPQTLSGALSIPGGVLAVLSERGATGTVTSEDSLQITALRSMPEAEYARPAPVDAGESDTEE